MTKEKLVLESEIITSVFVIQFKKGETNLNHASVLVDLDGKVSEKSRAFLSQIIEGLSRKALHRTAYPGLIEKLNLGGKDE